MPTTGPIGSYNRTVGVRLDMDEAINILPVDDVPLQRWLPSRTTASVKVEWMEEGFVSQTLTITALTGTGPWTITTAANGTDGFRVGDILRDTGATVSASDNTDIAKQYVITAIASGTSATIAGFGGTTATPGATTSFDIVGQYLQEGSTPLAARTQERTAQFNYTQIGQEKVEATRTARKRAMYAQEDPYDHELAKKFRELAIRFERQLVLGQRSISGGADQRSMGGLFYYLTSNINSGTAANVKATVNSALRAAWTSGGTPDTLMVSPAVKVAISANTNATERRWTMSDTIGGFTIEKLVTDFGEVDIVVNRYFPTKKALVLQRDYLSQVVFDGYHHELLAKTGDSDQGHIVGEFSLIAKNPSAHAEVVVTDAA